MTTTSSPTDSPNLSPLSLVWPGVMAGVSIYIFLGGLNIAAEARPTALVTRRIATGFQTLGAIGTVLFSTLFIMGLTRIFKAHRNTTSPTRR